MVFTRVKALNYTHYINLLAIAYAFVIPLSRAGISLFTGLLIVLWLFEGGLQKKLVHLWQNSVIKIIIIFILFNLLSLFWTDYLSESLGYIKKYWYFSPIIIFYTSLKKETIAKVLSAFILGMFISEIIAYGVFFELWEFQRATVENPSPFMHHIEYSVFLALTALILLGRIFHEQKIRYTLLYILFFITVSGNLFLTAGRTGQFAFVIGLFVLVLISFKSKLKALLVFSTLAVVILAVALNLSTTFYERVHKGKNELVNVMNNKEYCTSWGGRVGSWIVSKEIIRNHPLVGVGIMDNMKTFHNIIDTKYPEMKCMHQSFMHTHNQFFEVMTQTGMIGLLIFIMIFYRIFKLPIQEKQYSNMKYVYLSLLLFAFIPEVIFHRQFSMALFALVIGLLLAQYRTENEI